MTQPGELLCGRYRIERLLGQGGMADVYRAVDTTNDETVAVKLVRSSDPTLARRLAQETKALASLEHPGLVRLLDAGVHGEQAFLVMELVEGPTLSARLRRGPLSPSRTAVLGRTLAGALAYVHGQGIVHRDVKPGNVLLGPGPRARLADFGIARLVDESSLTMTGTTLGTAAYMAPEQLEHHAVGTAADVWSLGVILLECLTGQRVFEGTAPEVVARRLAGPVPLPPDLPAPWRLLFEGMLQHDPLRRPTAEQTAGLLSAEPYTEPWQPRPHDPDATVAVPAGIAAGAAGAAAAAGAGAALAGGTAGAAGAGSEPTATLPREDKTLVAPAAGPVPPVPAGPVPPVPAPPTGSRPGGEPGSRRNRWPWVWAAVAVAVLAAAGLSAWALSGNKPPGAPHHSTTTTSAPTTTTSSTTTTTQPSVTTAADALSHDVNAGVSSGAISAKAGRSIIDDLNTALSASSNGQPNQAASALQAMDATIGRELQSGSMSQAEASTLFADIATLANALGVSTPSTSTSTTAGTGSSTTTTSAGGEGNGNGH